MQSPLVKKLFHRKLSNDIEDCLAEDEESTFQPAEAGPGKSNHAEGATDPLPSSSEKDTDTAVDIDIEIEMPRTVRELLSDTRATEPRYVRLHNANYTPRELLSEILSMANRIVRRISEAQLNSADRRLWPVREVASKWDSIRAYPEMLQDADTELLKILVLDAYADVERIERA